MHSREEEGIVKYYNLNCYLIYVVVTICSAQTLSEIEVIVESLYLHNLVEFCGLKSTSVLDLTATSFHCDDQEGPSTR